MVGRNKDEVDNKSGMKEQAGGASAVREEGRSVLEEAFFCLQQRCLSVITEKSTLFSHCANRR